MRQYDYERAPARPRGHYGSRNGAGDAYGGPYQGKAGYKMSDITGKTGPELALEPYLHGTAGSSIVRRPIWAAKGQRAGKPYAAPQPGDNGFHDDRPRPLQAAAEESLCGKLEQ